MNKNNLSGKFIISGLFTIVFIFIFLVYGFAEIYVLKNGNRIKGKLKKETDTHFIIDAEGLGELSVAKDTVEQILKDEKTIEEEKIKSLQAIALDDFVTRLVDSYHLQSLPKAGPVLAIIPFQTEEPSLVEKKIGFGVAEVITDLLVQKYLKEFQVVERSKFEEVLSEQKMSISGLISENSAIKIGQILNADMLLLGSVSKVGENYSINARLVATETGKILAAESVSPSIREIEKGAKAYIDLPENWGVGYGIRYMGLTPKVWDGNSGNKTPTDNKDIMWKNGSDLRSAYFFVMAIRYFPIKDILIEFQHSPNPISPKTHGIDEYVDGSWYNRQSSGIGCEGNLTVNWVKKFGMFYTYLGGGVFYVVTSKIDMSSLTGGNKFNILPLLVRGAIEWRFRKRVGINLSFDYLPVTKEFTATARDGITYPMYTIDPLMITIFTAFYF